MQFDWNQLHPKVPLGDAKISLVQEICENFLNTGKGVPDHQKRAELGKNRILLNDLVQLGLIRNNWNRFYPTFSAMYCVSSPLRDSYLTILDLIIRAIKALYIDNGPQSFNIQQIDGQLNVLISGSNPGGFFRAATTEVHIYRATI